MGLLMVLGLVAAAQAGDAQAGFVIVAPAAWERTLQPFVEARGRELAVELAILEDLVSAGEGVDPPERIKRHLYRAWKERGARYALLVGDADTFPVRFMVLDRCTEPAFDYAFYPSDLYYADLADDRGAFDDWNAEREGFHGRYFGEVRGECNKDSPIDFDRVSYVPEIAVGRWPVSDEAALAAMVAKTLAWKPAGAAPRALVLYADGWVDQRERLEQEGLRLERAGFEVERQVYGSESAPTPQTVLRSLLGGVDLALHVGHGTNETWHACLGPAERDALAPAHPAVLVSVGCSTAHLCNEPPYDGYLDEALVLHRGTNAGEVFSEPPPPPACLQPGPLNSTGLGERLVRMPSGGAIAYIGCDTGAQPCAVTLLEGFTRGLAHAAPRRLGDAWREALAYYWETERLAQLEPTDSWYPPSIFFQGMKFLLLGDPTLVLVPGGAPDGEQGTDPGAAPSSGR
jgi:hypothetical protein